MEKIYTAIDLKSFYASVECIERGLDPLTTNLVVADMSRTEKTISLLFPLYYILCRHYLEGIRSRGNPIFFVNRGTTNKTIAWTTAT